MTAHALTRSAPLAAWRPSSQWLVSRDRVLLTGDCVIPETDAALVREMAAGDREAFSALYDRHASTMMALALRIVRDRRDAEEVVQDAFVQAWRQAARFDGARGSVGAWLVTMTRSRALDRLRRRGPVAVTEITENTLVTPPTEDTPAIGVAVRKVLDTLPPEQRRALELAYFDGMSQSEIAAHTGDPLGTVKTRVRLGLGRLRDALHVGAAS